MMMIIIRVHLAKEVVEGEQGSRQEKDGTCEPAGQLNDDDADAAADDDYD